MGSFIKDSTGDLTKRLSRESPAFEKKTAAEEDIKFCCSCACSNCLCRKSNLDLDKKNFDRGPSSSTFEQSENPNPNLPNRPLLDLDVKIIVLGIVGGYAVPVIFKVPQERYVDPFLAKAWNAVLPKSDSEMEGGHPGEWSGFI
jgi:hypothetical protein